MDKIELKFTNDFVREFMFDAEFMTILNVIRNGATPYQVIETLIRSKKELSDKLKESIENKPVKIIVTTEQFEQMQKQLSK